jgi:hypothetical protein
MAWLGLGLLGAAGCSGAPPQARYMTVDGDGSGSTVDADGDSSTSLGNVHFRQNLCAGYSLKPEYGQISYDHLQRFLTQQGFQVRVEYARRDLVYLDVSGNGIPEHRLRVAILDDNVRAGRELHEAILEHGAGAWGVHRANLAVLAPIGSTHQVAYFTTRSKLVCWGEVMMAGRDDTFVLAGGYREP